MKASPLNEIELYKASLKRVRAERDMWKSACVDMVIYEQYGHSKISYERHQEIFHMCYEATSANENEDL